MDVRARLTEWVVSSTTKRKGTRHTHDTQPERRSRAHVVPHITLHTGPCTGQPAMHILLLSALRPLAHATNRPPPPPPRRPARRPGGLISAYARASARPPSTAALAAARSTWAGPFSFSGDGRPSRVGSAAAAPPPPPAVRGCARLALAGGGAAWEAGWGGLSPRVCVASV